MSGTQFRGIFFMENERPCFILAGNGPYDNRGCEAIVRGTTKILRDSFREPRFICISHFQNENQFHSQRRNETDEAIIHLSSRRLQSKRMLLQAIWKPETLHELCQHLFKRDALFRRVYRDMIPYLDN